MKSRSAISAFFAAVISGLIWILVAAAGVIENSGGAWSQEARNVFFRNRSYSLMRKWMIDVTPTAWSLCIWEFIYTWNTLWVVYCVCITCRPVSDKISIGDTVTCNVNAFPPLFHWLWGLCGASHLAWFFFWDREILVGSVFFQVFVVAACVGCLYVSYTSVDRNGALLQSCYPWDLWVCRTLVQNGIAMLCTWTAILFLINVASILTYHGGIPSSTSSLGVIVVICISLASWFILDTFVLDRWVRYTFAVYPVIGWASLSMLVQHFQPWTNSTIITLCIFGLSSLIFIIRVPLVVWKSFSHPLYMNHTLPHVVRQALPKIPSTIQPDPTASTVL